METIKNTALEIYEKVKQIVIDTHNEIGDMCEIEIGNKMFNVDYDCSIELSIGMKSFDYDVPNDPDELEIEFNEIEVRNIWDDEKDFTNVIKALNKELTKIIL